nr:variable lymphocyte receptor [Lethenteron reissneri]
MVVPVGVFDRLVNLQQLYVSWNQLQALPTGVFNKLTQLTHLSLHTNQLKSIPMGAFDNRCQHCQQRSLLCRWALR